MSSPTRSRASASSAALDWPAAATLGYPLGRPPAIARACQLDLAWEAKLPRSRFPVAPDCEIPNSVIRHLYDPTEVDPRQFLGAPRRRRSLTSADTAERARQQQLAEAERDWLSGASLNDLEAALDNRRQMLEQLQRQAAAEAAAAAGSRASQQSPSRSEEADPTPTKERHQARPINVRTLPPIGAAAAPEIATPDQLGNNNNEETKSEAAAAATRDPTPTPATEIIPSTAPEEKLIAEEEQKQQKTIKKKARKPLVKKTKKTAVPGAGKDKSGQKPASDATEPKEESDKQDIQTAEPHQPPAQSILKTPTSAGSAADRQQLEAPPLPQVQVTERTDGQLQHPGTSSAERTRRVQFGDESAGTTATLLEQILAEPWFTLAEVPPAEKEPVARGLLQLMKFTVSGQDHSAMCDRIRDIKRQFDLEEVLHKSVEDNLVAQMAAIFEQSEEAGLLSEQRLKLLLIKGSATVSLLEFLGFSAVARLAQRWETVCQELERRLQEATAAAADAAAAAAAAAAASAESEKASAAAADAVLASASASSQGQDEGQELLEEPVLQLFEADLMTRLKNLPSNTDEDEREAATEVEELSEAGDVQLKKKSTTSSASSFKEAGLVKKPTRAASFADSGLGSSEVTSLTAANHHHAPGRDHTRTTLTTDGGETTLQSLQQLATVQQHQPPLTELSEEQQRSESSGSGSGSGSGGRVGGGAGSEGSRARPITASVRTERSAAVSGRSDSRIDSGSGSLSGRQSHLQDLPDLLLIDNRLDKVGQVAPQGGRQPLLPQHTGLYDLLDDHRIRKMLKNLPKLKQIDTEAAQRRARQIVYGPNRVNNFQTGEKEFVPGRDNVICAPGSGTGRSPALILAIDKRHSLAGKEIDAQKASSKRRVTILTPTGVADEQPRTNPPQPFSFMTRARTELKFAASSSGGRPSYIGSRDWAKLCGSAGDEGLPSLAGGTEQQQQQQHRLAWPEHCRMDSLARRGFHRSGISISKHLDRYTLIDTVGRGLRVSTQKQAELSLTRSSTSLQNLSAV